MIQAYQIKAIKKGSEYGYIVNIHAEKKDEAIEMAKRKMKKMITGIDTKQYDFSVESKQPVIVEINPLHIIGRGVKFYASE